MKILKTLFAALILLAGVSSCSDDNDIKVNPVTTLILNPNVSFSSVKTLADGTWDVCDAPTYTFEVNTQTFNVKLEVKGLNYADKKGVDFTIENLLLTVDPQNNAWTIANRNPMVVRDSNGNDHEITGFNAYIFSSGRAPENVRVQYTIDNAYTIRAIMKYNAFVGKSLVTAESPAIEPFNNESAVYFFILNHKEKKASVLIYNAKFSSGMPRTIDMDFLKHSFTVDDRGIVVYSPERFEPLNNNVPYEKYAVTNLDFVLSPGLALDGSFMVADMFTVSVEATPALALTDEVLRKMTVAMGK